MHESIWASWHDSTLNHFLYCQVIHINEVKSHHVIRKLSLTWHHNLARLEKNSWMKFQVTDHFHTENHRATVIRKINLYTLLILINVHLNNWISYLSFNGQVKVYSKIVCADSLLKQTKGKIWATLNFETW